MRYLVHNIYGDADQLIANAPDDVICVPFGWTTDIELNRNRLLANLGLNGVSCLPVVLFLKPAEEITVTTMNNQTEIINIAAHWKEVRVFDMPQPWNWADIDNLQNTL